MTVANALDELESYIPQKDSLKTDVSEVSVGWHLYHSCIVIQRVYSRLEQADPSAYHYEPNLRRTALFTSGIIPRGRAKAPRSVIPPENFTEADIHTQLAEARKCMNTFDELPANSHMTHHVIGTLNRDHARRFLDIHTHHHLRIIQDILK